MKNNHKANYIQVSKNLSNRQKKEEFILNSINMGSVSRLSKRYKNSKKYEKAYQQYA
jgi:hypothetical protein